MGFTSQFSSHARHSHVCTAIDLGNPYRHVLPNWTTIDSAYRQITFTVSKDTAPHVTAHDLQATRNYLLTSRIARALPPYNFIDIFCRERIDATMPVDYIHDLVDGYRAAPAETWSILPQTAPPINEVASTFFAFHRAFVQHGCSLVFKPLLRLHNSQRQRQLTTTE